MVRRAPVLIWRSGLGVGGGEVSQQSEESAMLSARGVEGGKEREVVVKWEALEMLAKEFGLYHKSNGDSSEVSKQGSDLLSLVLVAE